MRHLGDAGLEAGVEDLAMAPCPGAVVPDRLTIADLGGRLRSRVIRGPFLYHEQVASTNAEARSLAIDGASEGTVVIAESQTAGRGRLGRRWSSPPGQGLLFSVVFRPTLPMSEVHLLTLVVACAAARAIEATAPVPIGIKWPNDLFCGDRKVGGILLEIGGAQEVVDWVVAGIGINVNTDLSALPGALSQTAGSLRSAGGAPVDRTELLLRTLLQLDEEYTAALACGFAGALDGFRGRDYLFGRDVALQTKDGPVIGRAEGINACGALILRSSQQQVRFFHAGEVSLRV